MNIFIWAGIALVVLLVGRVLMRFLDPEMTLWRKAQDAAVTLVVLAALVDFSDSSLDRASGYPGTGEFLSSAIMAFGAGWTLVYMRTLRELRPPTSRRARGMLALAAAIAVVETVIWAIWQRHVSLDMQRGTPAGRVNEILSQGWMGSVCGYSTVVLSSVVQRLWRSTRWDRAQAIGMLLTTLAVAIVTCACTVQVGMAVLGLYTPDRQYPLSAAKGVAGLLFAVGVLTATTIPSLLGREALSAELGTLTPLWRHVQRQHPEVVLPLGKARPQLQISRAYIEISDALQRIHVRGDTASGPESLAAAIADAVPAATPGAVTAASLMPPTSDRATDLAHIHELAAAWHSMATVPAR